MSNIRNNNPISDAEIIKNIAKAVNRSITMVSEEIGEKKGTLFQITTGRNNISARVRAGVLNTYKDVNPEYINTGRGEILLKPKTGADDEFKEEVFMQLARLNKKSDIISEKLGQLIIAMSKN